MTSPPSPSRVLMTADTVGGVWTYAGELARSLVPRGIAVTLAAMGGRASAAQRKMLAGIPGFRLFESEYRLEWMEDCRADVAASGDWLLDIARATSPDLVHLNNYAHAALGWRVPCLVVGHSCVLSWWEAVRGGAAPAEWDWYRATVTAGLAAADRVVAPSAAMLAALDRHYGVGRRGTVIANGCATAGRCPAAKQPFVMAAGRLWDEAKNLAALDRIAGRLAWPVLVAGPWGRAGSGRAAFSGVRLLGPLARAELRRRLAEAAIFALPARYEPFGLSILEAAVAGCALVLGDIPSLRENWEGAALFVPPDDVEGLHAALASLIAEPQRRAVLAALARRRSRAFGARRMAAAYAALYAELLSGQAAPRQAGGGG